MLTAALRDKKKDYLIALTKSTNIILKFINKSLYPLLQNKTAAEI